MLLFSPEAHCQTIFSGDIQSHLLFIGDEMYRSACNHYSCQTGPIKSLSVGGFGMTRRKSECQSARFDCICWCPKPLISGLATKGTLSPATGSNREPSRHDSSSRRLYEGCQCFVSGYARVPCLPELESTWPLPTSTLSLCSQLSAISH